MDSVGFAWVFTGVEALGPMGHQRSGYGRWGIGYIVLVCLLGLGDIVMGQERSTWDPIKQVCNMALARGVVLGDKMYVDGGQIMDEMYYKFGVDKPSYSSGMTWWQSESNQCPILFN